MIRRAELSDVAEMVVCVDAAYAALHKRGIKLPAVSEGLDQDVRDHLVWLSLGDGRIEGVIVVAAKGDHAHLMNIAVHPDATGKGIAKSLIDTSILQLRRLNVGRMDLTTHVDIPENVSLYEYLGWKETGRSATKVHMSRVID